MLNWFQFTSSPTQLQLPQKNNGQTSASLSSQKKGAQGERKKGGQTGTLTPGADAPTGPFSVRDVGLRGTGENMDGGVRFCSTRRADGTRD